MNLPKPTAVSVLFLSSIAIILLAAWILFDKLEVPASGFVVNPTGTVSASVQATADIFLQQATVNFGAVQVGVTYDTTGNYSNASRFLLRNDGSVKTNVTITAIGLWTSISQTAGSSAYRWNATNATGNTSIPTNCVDSNQNTWYSVPLTAEDPSALVCNLNFSDGNDYSKIDIQITVPTGEAAGAKTSTVTFTASQA